MFHFNEFLKPQAKINQLIHRFTDSCIPTGQQDPYDKTGSNNNTVEVSFFFSCLSPSGKFPSLALWVWSSCECVQVCVCVHVIRESWKQNILKRGFAFCSAFKALCLRHIDTIQQGSKGRGAESALVAFLCLTSGSASFILSAAVCQPCCISLCKLL